MLLSVHKSAEVSALWDGFGVRLEFFVELKVWVKKNRGLALAFGDVMEDSLSCRCKANTSHRTLFLWRKSRDLALTIGVLCCYWGRRAAIYLWLLPFECFISVEDEYC